MFRKYKFKIAVIATLMVIICLAWVMVRPASIVRVDGASVYVENLPLTTEGKISWWNDNKAMLQNRYSVIKDKSHFTVAIMNFGGYVELPTGSNDGSVDDYHCFNDVKSNKKCIYNNISMIINGDLNKKVFISLDGKFYVQTPDNKIEPVNSH
ncbi:hypothetical protein HL670_01098 [Serratia plymuthica]|uniref:DUF943 family protein n=1 Tax=Serratia plymuthica TaxID=82996 RepID=UPI0007895098|nr:DUF943 family protein [Serratia plymuthica]QJW54230.1 hypothetical protein HL670_01098 [Serratia plymuthica]